LGSVGAEQVATTGNSLRTFGVEGFGWDLLPGAFENGFQTGATGFCDL